MSSPSFHLSVFLAQILVLFSLCARSAYSVKPQCHREDMSALLQFKSSFTVVAGSSASGSPLAYPKTEYWMLRNEDNGTSSNCCLWDGVLCDERTGRVIRLDLSSSFLYGSINSSSSLFRLAHLRRINLADNDFNYSQVPTGFGIFSSLTHLNLSMSAFSGLVPQDISKLSRLVSLDMGYNVDHYGRGLIRFQTSGFSSLVENLTLLEELVLTDVNISSSVPGSLANLSSLRILRLGGTDLRGEFPASVFQLPKLEIITLHSNEYLTGRLPEFNSSSPLQILLLQDSNFSGELPPSIGNLRSLSYLDIAGCKFSGSIPSSFGNLTELTYLEAAGNLFTAQKLDSMPWLWKLTKLTTLGFNQMDLQGEIPSSIGNLSQLVSLNFTWNELTGRIPPQLTNLNRLTHLFLRMNQLSGHIPSWLINMTQLVVLDLAANRLEGPIPTTVSQLRNLQVLRLFRNNLSGTLELDTFFPLKNLRVLQLSRNKLSLVTRSGTNSSLPQLRALGLASCNLTEFPEFLRNQSEMNWLDLSSNKLHGEIPSWVCNESVDSLVFLNLSHNSLTGFDQWPRVLPWKYLHTLDLTSNLLEGPIPIPQTSISSYLVSNNKLTGKFPDLVCNWSSLVILDLSFNSLTGELPQCLGSVSSSLSILNLQRNRLQGKFPEFKTSSMQLRMISLAQNHFQGKLPRSLADCLELRFINFGDNWFDDSFPAWLESLPELRVLILRSNQLRGSIGRPGSGLAFQKLRIIDLSRNSLSGKLPHDYFGCWKGMKVVDAVIGKLSYMNQSLIPAQGYLAYTYYGNYDYSMTIINKGLELYYPKISDVFTAIDLSGNVFEGEVPDVLGELKELHLLNLSSNFLTGKIPTALANLRALESLDLSRNRLSGEIPQELTTLHFLSVLDVSYNNLTGPIPRGKQFETFPNSTYEGNEGLCGDVLSRRCGGSGLEPAGKTFEDPGSDSYSEFDWRIIMMGYAGGLVVGVVIGCVFVSDQRAWFAAITVRVTEHRRRRHISRKRGRRT